MKHSVYVFLHNKSENDWTSNHQIWYILWPRGQKVSWKCLQRLSMPTSHIIDIH